jgi:hypothetical protein
MSSKISEFKEYKIYIDLGNCIAEKIYSEIFKCIDKPDYNMASKWVFILRTILHQVHYDGLLRLIRKYYGSEVLQELIESYEERERFPESINDEIKIRFASIISECKSGWIDISDLKRWLNIDED